MLDTIGGITPAVNGPRRWARPVSRGRTAGGVVARGSPPTERVVQVLDLLASAERGLRSSEVARTLRLTTSTAATLLATLEAADYVERSPDKTYRLGPGLLGVAGAVHDRFPLLGAGHDELQGLAHDLACGVTLTCIGTDHLRVVATVGHEDQFPLGVSPGDCFPRTAPYGVIAMAWRPPAEIDAWLDGWPPAASAAERAHERQVMEDIRTTGVGVWSLDAHAVPVVRQLRAIIDEHVGDPESEKLRAQLTALFAMFGQRGYTAQELRRRASLPVGYALAPIFGPDATPRYQIDLHLLRQAMTRRQIADVCRRLTQSARALTATIGGEPPGALWSGTDMDHRRAG